MHVGNIISRSRVEIFGEGSIYTYVTIRYHPTAEYIGQ